MRSNYLPLWSGQGLDARVLVDDRADTDDCSWKDDRLPSLVLYWIKLKLLVLASYSFSPSLSSKHDSSIDKYPCF